jgi:hypothetical protein
MNIQWSCICVAILIAAGCSGIATATRLERQAEALSEHFETVAYAGQPALASVGWGQSSSPLQMLLLPHDALFAALAHVDRLADGTIRRATSVLIGGRAFRPPRGLGSMLFQFCYVARLPDSSLLDEIMSRAAAVKEAEGLHQWAVVPGNELVGDRVYGVREDADTLLVCTDRADVTTVARTLRGSRATGGGINAWPIHERERADVWMYRRRSTQPGPGSTQWGGFLTADAVGLSARIDERRATFRIVRPAPEAEGYLERAANPLRRQPSAGDTWEASWNLDDRTETVEKDLDALAWFGFGVLL